MKRKLLNIAASAFLATIASVSYADPICSLGAGNLGLTSVSCSVSGNIITVRETFGSDQMGSIAFSGLTQYADYVIQKYITNASGKDFNRIANELLDPAGQANDQFDKLPYDSFVPAGYTQSNESDGLSFAQDSNLARTSSVFTTVISDELSDERDFLDFRGGILPNGSTDSYMTFGIRDMSPADNQAFLLIERPNVDSKVPEPTTLLLLTAAILAMIASRRQNAK